MPWSPNLESSYRDGVTDDPQSWLCGTDQPNKVLGQHWEPLETAWLVGLEAPPNERPCFGGPSLGARENLQIHSAECMACTVIVSSDRRWMFPCFKRCVHRPG
jgi:hypothetical protein